MSKTIVMDLKILYLKNKIHLLNLITLINLIPFKSISSFINYIFFGDNKLNISIPLIKKPNINKKILNYLIILIIISPRLLQQCFSIY